jgi:hypothetical protein
MNTHWEYGYLVSSVAQSCGPCWSGFVGFDKGAANTLCYPTLAAAQQQMQLQQAKAGNGSVSMKSCAVPDCSGHGRCAFFDSDSGAGLSLCGQGDLRCEARCLCDASFSGGRFCELDDQAAALQRSVRTGILQGLAQVIDSEFPSAEAVQDWASSLVEASRAADQLTASSAAAVLNMTRTVLRSARSAQLSGGAVSNLLAAVDAATSQVGATSLSANDSAATLQEYAAFVASSLLPGQVAVQATQSDFRLTVAASTWGSTLTLPQDQLEQAAGQAASHLALPASHSNSSSPPSAVVVSLISMRSGLYSNRDRNGSSSAVSSSFQSNPLLTQFSSWPCQGTAASPSGACEIVVVLQNSRPVVFQNRTRGEQVNITCAAALRPYRASHNCRSGFMVYFNCSGGGRRSLHTLTCPFVSTAPSCRLLLGRPSAACRLTHFTATNTTCICTLTQPSLPSDHGRRLGLGSGSGAGSAEDGNTSTYSLSVVNMLDIIAESAQETILSAQVRV